MKEDEQPYYYDPPRCGKCSIPEQPIEKSYDDESGEWYCEQCKAEEDLDKKLAKQNDKYEDQPFIWREEWTTDDIREMIIVRFDRIARERWDKAKKPRTLDTIGEMEAKAIDAFFLAFKLRMKRARALIKLGHGLEIPPE
jgi:hypothetical protein